MVQQTQMIIQITPTTMMGIGVDGGVMHTDNDDTDEFDPLGDEAEDASWYEGCGIPGCDCSTPTYDDWDDDYDGLDEDSD